MKKAFLIKSICLFLPAVFFCNASAQEATFQYPYYLLDSYNPDNDCWYGMNVNGIWPVSVLPEQLLIGPPPSELSGVTIPSDHWLEFKFRGRLIDGPGDDIFLIERDAVNEQALVFITDNSEQEYLLGYAFVPDRGYYEQTEIGFDIAGISLPFVPSAIRIVGLDFRGGSPGFDLANVRTRVNPDCGLTACNPSPPNGAKNVPIDTVLKWSPGTPAEKHIVYFGTSLADVGANAIPVNEPSQPQDTNSFKPPALELGKTYYWRIDQINDNEPNSPWKGNIWKFTTIDHLVTDNFESYNSSTPLYDTWTKIDNGMGYIALSKTPKPVHTCRQALEFRYYYESSFHSRTVNSFTPAQDWASAGIKALELFFYGKYNNNTNVKMYIAISDGDVNEVIPYAGDVNDLKNETWQVWKIDLQNLGLNLSNIENISIGFDKPSPEYPFMGTGTVFFDDISLHPSRCLEENEPDADFNCDCSVDFLDLQELSTNWLLKGYNIYPMEAPNAPVAWYKFDGNTNDSAGSFHGWKRGNPNYVDGVHGRAISFDGYNDSLVINGATELFLKTQEAITIAFWQYGADSVHHIDTLCCSDYTYNVYDPVIAINLGCWKSPGKYNWDCGAPWSFDNRLSGKHKYKTEWSQRWNHWAFTKETTTGKMQIYLNGVLYDSRIGANSPISGITSFEIGSGWYGGYDGLIDDFQIYDYVLSQPEIAYAATNGTGIFDLPLLSPVDLNSDDKIDFKDFCLFADSWLDKNLWP
ncbi:MAG: LamG domain-containing protein [Sedimentisphaerales bacterium]|nr:LamG domain-containing protein [Sedimentisphaerales bacterium]